MASPQARAVGVLYRTLLKPVLRSEDDVQRLRAHLQRFDVLAGRLPRGTHRERVALGECDGEWISVPDSDPWRVVLYLPGGGFVARAPRLHRPLVARICREGAALALIAHYRLAPEHPFPAALEDAVAAYRSLLDDDFEPGSIVLGGDSAGGCLALSTLLALRERGLPQPAGAFLLSPVTDLHDHREGSRHTNAAKDSLLTMDRALDLHGHYVGGDDSLLSDPLVSPVFGDFAGLPPLLFHVSSSEILLDDSLRAAGRARAAGVACEVDVFDGVPHVWHVAQGLPEARRAIRRLGAFIRACAPLGGVRRATTTQPTRSGG